MRLELQMKSLNVSSIKENEGDFQDSYQIAECIGRGTLGEVRVCIHKLTG
jgi:hypothetical protein